MTKTSTTDTCNLPAWRTRVHLFDGLEISPCMTVRGESWGPCIEVCDPADAEFWSVYGHYNPELCDGFGGVDCLEDFATQAEALAFGEELYRSYPHLRPEVRS